jgi:hypothetical protein
VSSDSTATIAPAESGTSISLHSFRELAELISLFHVASLFLIYAMAGDFLQSRAARLMQSPLARGWRLPRR